MIGWHKGCGWKFKDHTTATIFDISEGQEKVFVVEVKIPGADHEYIFRYKEQELRGYIDSNEIISMTFNGWLNELAIEEW